jgi:hypothetical protein
VIEIRKYKNKNQYCTECWDSTKALYKIGCGKSFIGYGNRFYGKRIANKVKFYLCQKHFDQLKKKLGEVG